MSEHIVKACPRCGQPLEIKVNRETGHEFLGCSAWRLNGCTHTEALPESIKLRRAGQRGLFDEDEAAPAHRPHEHPIPAGAAIERCRSCQAEIVWTKTANDHAVPLSLATVQTRNGIAYAQSHFLDCPEAREWRKGRKR